VGEVFVDGAPSHLSRREREGPDREAVGRVRGYVAAD